MRVEHFLFVAAGGMAGSLLRYVTGYWLRSTGFPWATLLVNLLGCFLIGIIMGFFQRDAEPHLSFRLLLATGFCGGFTTFSAFAWENWQMLEQQRYLAFLGYIAVSLAGGIILASLGWLISKS